MTTLIDPGGLEPDAVLPQCLDNQFVTDVVHADMIRRDVDFRDAKVAAQRADDFATEFMRSLVYSSQVVIQRAYLRNSHFLYQNYKPENGESLRAFAQLLRDRAIVPYLYKERSLADELDFDLTSDGDVATRALLEHLGDEVTCVRLAVDNDANNSAADAMAADFGTKIARLQFLDGQQRSAMAAELFGQPERLLEPGTWDAFNDAINRFAMDSFIAAGESQAAGEGHLSRNEVYRRNFVAEVAPRAKEDPIALGRFRPPSVDKPFPLELKKFVDLVYNTNLPDRLGRYTFTPLGMPSRMALQDDPGVGTPATTIADILTDREGLREVQRAFLAHSQRAMHLPLLRDLTVADVVEVRQLDEWVAFRDTQTRVLENPTQCLDLLDGFQETFDSFQRSLSHWYNLKYRRAATEERYSSVVSLALSVGGNLIVGGSDLEGAAQWGGHVGTAALPFLPARIKGFAAKLMVGVYDHGRKQLDRDRSYSIELMQTNTELMRDDVMSLLEQVTVSGDRALPSASGVVADQGIL